MSQAFQLGLDAEAMTARALVHRPERRAADARITGVQAEADLARTEAVNPQAMADLNRLSDLMFVLARVANDGGRDDILWQPGLTGDG